MPMKITMTPSGIEPARSAVPQPTAPPRAPKWRYVSSEKSVHLYQNIVAEKNGNMKIDNRRSEMAEKLRYLGGKKDVTNQDSNNGKITSRLK
jgi:hypothetical protein